MWQVAMDNDVPLALFRIEANGSKATISELCLEHHDAVVPVASILRKGLSETGISEISLRVSPSREQALAGIGFQRRDTCLRFSRVPEEVKMMPILPLMNATQKEVPILSQLLFDAYARAGNGFTDVGAAERYLRNMMSGGGGRYLTNASFASGALTNLVSACLITEYSPGEARITQMFTHPLYRARGLTTAEIASGMRWLLGAGCRRLIVWNSEGNAVVTRLLKKMGFNEDERVREMVSSV
jgi:GNAT superfamily N-acetyltransferase